MDLEREGITIKARAVRLGKARDGLTTAST
jgi:hypothetical protein